MSSAGRSGPVAALRRIVETLLTIGQTRLQLLGNEIQVEKHRALKQLVRVLLAVACTCMAAALGIGLLLVLMWDQRVAVLSVLIVLLLGLALWLLHSAKQVAQTHEHPFAASLAELQDDLQQLRAASHHGASQEPL